MKNRSRPKPRKPAAVAAVSAAAVKAVAVATAVAGATARIATTSSSTSWSTSIAWPRSSRAAAASVSPPSWWSATSNGRVGYGHGKAREVPEAIRKATEEAKKSMIRVPLKDGRTLHHEVRGHHGAGKVVVRPAPAGTGVIAGGPMRAVFESLGVGDIVAKSLGTSNAYNMVRATFDALKNQQSPRMVAQRRGRSVTDIIARREGQKAEQASA